jgi:hypothetical protein
VSHQRSRTRRVPRPERSEEGGTPRRTFCSPSRHPVGEVLLFLADGVNVDDHSECLLPQVPPAPAAMPSRRQAFDHDAPRCINSPQGCEPRCVFLPSTRSWGAVRPVEPLAYKLNDSRPTKTCRPGLLSQQSPGSMERLVEQQARREAGLDDHRARRKEWQWSFNLQPTNARTSEVSNEDYHRH